MSCLRLYGGLITAHDAIAKSNRAEVRRRSAAAVVKRPVAMGTNRRRGHQAARYAVAAKLSLWICAEAPRRAIRNGG